MHVHEMEMRVVSSVVTGLGLLLRWDGPRVESGEAGGMQHASADKARDGWVYAAGCGSRSHTDEVSRGDSRGQRVDVMQLS